MFPALGMHSRGTQDIVSALRDVGDDKWTELLYKTLEQDMSQYKNYRWHRESLVVCQPALTTFPLEDTGVSQPESGLDVGDEGGKAVFVPQYE